MIGLTIAIRKKMQVFDLTATWVGNHCGVPSKALSKHLNKNNPYKLKNYQVERVHTFVMAIADTIVSYNVLLNKAETKLKRKNQRLMRKKKEKQV